MTLVAYGLKLSRLAYTTGMTFPKVHPYIWLHSDGEQCFLVVNVSVGLVNSSNRTHCSFPSTTTSTLPNLSLFSHDK